MPKRAAVAAAAIGLLVMVAMVAVTRAMPPIVMSSDLAMAEVSTALAARGELMVGPYSRFGWNHPGPLYFYVLAPLYTVAGQNASALFVTAVAINLGAILVLAWSLRDHGRGLLSFAAVVACLILAWRLPRLLASPWTAHVPVLASLAFIATAGAVAAGRHRLLPLMVLAGTFIAQTHLGYVPMVGVLGSVAVASLIVQKRQSAVGVLTVSAGLWLLLWLPVLTEAAMNDGGNLAALWRFFVIEGGSGQSFSEALAAWGFGLTGILRGDLALPWGGHFAMPGSWWRLSVAAGQVVILAAIAWRGLRAGRRFEAGVAGAAALASIVGLWSVTRIHGDVLDHELLGLVALGAMNLAILAHAAVRAVWPASASWREPLVAAACAIALVASAAVARRHLIDFTSFERRRSDTARIPATYEVLRSFLEQRAISRPLVRMHGDAWADGAGIVLRLLQAGWPVTVADDNRPAFPQALSATGQEDALVDISPREGTHLEMAGRPGNITLRDRHPLFVDVILPGRR